MGKMIDLEALKKKWGGWQLERGISLLSWDTFLMVRKDIHTLIADSKRQGRGYRRLRKSWNLPKRQSGIRRNNPMRKLSAIALMAIALLCTSCDLDHTKVRYTINGRHIECHDASDTSKYQSDGYQAFTCVWHCADYKGAEHRYVSLTFRYTDHWYLQSEFVSTGICQSMGSTPMQP